MLEVKELYFSYRKDQPNVLKDISFNIFEKQIVSFIGESGSGKSTLLKLMYGLLTPVSGEILLDEKKVKGPLKQLVPGNEDMRYVAQDYDLSDHVTAAENVGKFLSNFAWDEKWEIVREQLRIVGLEEFYSVKPNQLSGGQQQRVALARAMAVKPKLLLLDEPFSNLDQSLKFHVRENILKWAKENGITVIFTTHDIQDALGYSDKIYIMDKGEIIQSGHPEEVYLEPKNEYAASLFGVFNQFNREEMNHLFGIEIPEGYTALIYPEEFRLISHQGAFFRVLGSRFYGRDFRVELSYEDRTFYVYSPERITSAYVHLKVNRYRLLPGH